MLILYLYSAAKALFTKYARVNFYGVVGNGLLLNNTVHVNALLP